MPTLRSLLCGALSLSVGLAACNTATTSPAKALTLHDCQLGSEGSPLRVPAQCGVWRVYENRAAQTGRQIELRVAVYQAISTAPEPDPIFVLAGGPGQAATESFLGLMDAFDRLHRDRDIVLVDQRGTGQLSPLVCATPDSNTQLDSNDPAQQQALLQTCLAEVQPKADPIFYTTALAMDDLDEIRAALGYEKINLYGVSYGTRAAQVYLRRYADRVRTVILDGITTPEMALGLDMARDAQRALDLMFTRCETDAACATAFPTVRADFAALRAELQAAPVAVTLPHPVTHASTTITLTHGSLVQTVRLLSYQAETVALLPLLIHHTHRTGEWNAFTAQIVSLNSNLARSINNLMSASVICAEDAPFFTPDKITAAVADTYMGDEQIKAIQNLCAVWPHQPVTADFKEPLALTVPTLLLSGEIDPVTPPAYGDHLAQLWPNSRHVVALGQGHNVLPYPCIARIATDFVTQGSVANLDTRCADSMTPAPFFTSFTGPQP